MQPQSVKSQITYLPRRSAPAKLFDPAKAYDEVAQIVTKKLRGKSYESEEASKLTKELADEVRAKVRIVSANRYKICVQVSIFSQKGQGIYLKGRNFWDQETDFEVSYIYQGEEIVSTVNVYGIYFY
ncbi:Tctex-1 family protein [Spironucleus salmonicida]|uniref:Dynein light chain n=1 Tax=Spironucleus salmonicida TaxID=348837 RepID=V6LE10_9EUKA|nr:Tctex-1 family protein [Spironucleus salmonicida]|eukprot:EST41931.1 Dynein light chain [Spironucleus salmonicida]